MNNLEESSLNYDSSINNVAGGESSGKAVTSLNGIWSMYKPDDEKTARAKKVQFISINQRAGNPTAECNGSRGEIYTVSLEECSCVDFSKNKRVKPCKHMIALAMKCKVLNDNGLTFQQDCDLTTFELSMKVAIASGFFHVFNKPVISDNLYNALKYELWDWCRLVSEEDVVGLDTKLNESELELFNMPLHDFESYIKSIICNAAD